MNMPGYPQNAEQSVISDDEIIKRVLAGEKDLYAIIVRRYNERLYRVAVSMINDQSEIEDAIQCAYINAYEHLSDFAFRAAFSTWLTRIMINECLQRRKKIKYRLLWNKVFGRYARVNYLNQVQTPAVNMLNTELKARIEEAISKLPQKYRLVFVMREIENMTVAETRDCLNITDVNVKVRLNRARTMLRNYLSRYYSKEEIFHFHLSRCDKIVENVMGRIRVMDSHITMKIN